MKLKWWFRVNQNKLYRKYNFDPHGYIIRKAQITKTFKFLLKNFKYGIFKKLYVRRIQTNRYKSRFLKALKKKKWKYKFDWKTAGKRNKRKVAKRILKKWNYTFWDKFKNNYFNKNFSNLKQTKYSSFFFLKIFKRSVHDKFTKSYIIKKLKKKFYRKNLNSPRLRRRLRVTLKNAVKRKKRKLMRRITWLNVLKYRKKQKAWWLLRVTNKKAAFFYGITKLKKFRYINKLNNRNIPLTTYYNYKLDSMLNIFLFRLNLFDNIFIVNNFIRIAGIVLVNNKRVVYPFRFVKVGDIISLHPKYFKRMFNIFYKRSKFNKSFIMKRIKSKNNKISSSKLLKSVKNFINIPSGIEYNYKIMHFVMWRLPYENEFLGLNFKFFNTHIWAFETQLQYN